MAVAAANSRVGKTSKRRRERERRERERERERERKSALVDG